MPTNMKLTSKKINGYTIYYYIGGDRIHKFLGKWKSGSPPREPCFSKIIEMEVEPGYVVVDVGTNVGYYTSMILARMNKRGVIYAAEPDDRNYYAFVKFVRANKLGSMIKIKNVAVAGHKGSVCFYLSKKATNLSSIVKTRHSWKAVDVKCTTVGGLTGGKIPNFVKMDIEGSEVEVLGGMYSLVADNKAPCKILMEVHPKLYDKNRSFVSQLESYFSIGFVPKYIVSATSRCPVVFKKLGYTPSVLSPTGVRRAIYTGVSCDDALFLCSAEHKEYCPSKKKSGKSVRAILLERV